VIGKAVRRVEDRRFLEGSGRFIADLALPGELHCAIVRSPHPHARILSIGIPPGVTGFTGRDMAADEVGPLRAGWRVGADMREVPRWRATWCATSASRSPRCSLEPVPWPRMPPSGWPSSTRRFRFSNQNLASAGRAAICRPSTLLFPPQPKE
jgi:CO/xanthine dehydrogenase Mo-binding subunit